MKSPGYKLGALFKLYLDVPKAHLPAHSPCCDVPVPYTDLDLIGALPYTEGVLQTKSLSQVSGSPQTCLDWTLERQRRAEATSTCGFEHT